MSDPDAEPAVLAMREPVPGPGYSLHERPTSNGVDLRPSGSWTSEIREVFDSGQADGLNLAGPYPMDLTDLSFLDGLPLKRLYIRGNATDLEPVNGLASTLEELWVFVLAKITVGVRLGEFSSLRRLHASWAAVSKQISRSTGLHEVYLEGYREPDLTCLAGNESLLSLHLKERPHLMTLDGIENFQSLRSLGISLAQRLGDIAALEDVTSLEEVSFESCRKIDSVDPLAASVALRRLTIADCGSIRSLAPLEGLNELRVIHMYESTNIHDGDLSVLSRLPELRELRAQSRRHYRPSVAEIQHQLGGGG